MSSSAKKAKTTSREIRTNSDGRRYVDMDSVIKSELKRIEDIKRGNNATSQSDRAKDRGDAKG